MLIKIVLTIIFVVFPSVGSYLSYKEENTVDGLVSGILGGIVIGGIFSLIALGILL